MTAPILGDEQTRRLNIATKLGASKAAESLTKWIGTKFITTSVSTTVVHYSKLIEPYQSSEDIVTAILIPISGTITGHMLFIFNETSTKRILAKLLHRNIDSLAEWDTLRRSAMEETGNIIGTSFINTLSMDFNFEIHPSSPVMACDYAEAFWDTLLSQHAIYGEYALSCQVTFNTPHDRIEGTLSIIPDNLHAWKEL